MCISVQKCYFCIYFSVFFLTVVLSEDRGPLMEIKIGGTFLPVEASSQSRAAPAASTRAPKHSSLPPLPKDVGVEKYSGLRLR